MWDRISRTAGLVALSSCCLCARRNRGWAGPSTVIAKRCEHPITGLMIATQSRVGPLSKAAGLVALSLLPVRAATPGWPGPSAVIGQRCEHPITRGHDRHSVPRGTNVAIDGSESLDLHWPTFSV